MSASKEPSSDPAGSAATGAGRREEETPSHGLFVGGPTVVFKWRATTGWPVEYVSPNIRQFGYAPEDFLSGRIPYADIVHPEDVDRVAAEVRQHTESGAASFEQEYRIKDRDGNIRWVYDYTTVVRDMQGGATHYHGYVLDITARKHIEDALRESRAHYEAMVESFDGLVYICSADYKVEFMNQRFIERTGYNAVGHLCYKSLHNLDGVCPWCVNEDVLRGKTVRWEVQSPKDNRWYYVVNTPIRHPDGSISKMAMIQDVTERKHAEEMLRRRETILEAVGFASEQFMRKEAWEQCIHDVLARIGQAAGVGRVFVSENLIGMDNSLQLCRRFEWTAPGTSPLLYHPDLQHFALRSRGFGRWEEVLSRGHVVQGHVKELPEAERALLTGQGIQSIVVVPVSVEGAWWGVLGLEACSSEREWSAGETEALKTAAGLLGTAIQRTRSEEALRKSEERNRIILNAMPDLMFRIRRDGTFLDFKAESARDLAAPPTRIIGRKVVDILPPKVAALTMQHIRLAMETGERQVYEYDLDLEDRQGRYEARMVVSGKDEVLTIVRDITDRRRSEEQLLKLSGAVAQTADSVMIMDKDGRIEYVNPAFERLTGFSCEEAVGKRPPDLLDAGRHDHSFYASIDKTLAAGESVRVEFVNRKKNGDIYCQATTITPIRDSEGMIVNFVSTGRDVTERVAATEALRASEKRMADMINFLPDATFAIDRQGKVIAWNRAMEAMSGVKASAMLGKDDCEYALPFYGKRRPLLIDLVLAPDADVEKEYKYVERVKDTLIAEVEPSALKHTGIALWVIAAPLYDSEGNVVGAIESLRDITERERSQATIRKLAAFPQFDPNPVLEFAPDGTLIYFNRAAKQTALALGKEDPLHLVPGDVQEIVRNCLATNETRQGLEVTIGRQTIRWAFCPVADGPSVHAYGHDITDRLELESQLRQLQKMEAVGRLAGGVAHDFNNILTAILGYSSMLLLEKKLDSDTSEQLKEIARAADRASNLTRQLLTFSRKQAMQTKPLNLNAILRGISPMLRRLINENIMLEISEAEDLPAIYADESMMEQVILNLVVNARDAMPKGGRIRVTTGVVEVAPDVTLHNPEARAGRFVCMSVHDTGCGMSSSVQAQIFEPFFTTKQPGEGTGLGLATVYGVVKQHDGWVEVQSEENKGALFKVYLPVHTGPVRREPQQSGAAPVKGGDETILVVEDEATVRILACSVLRQYGYTVIEAGSGAEGLSVWEKHGKDVDLLLTDVVMPGGLTGIELADRLLKKRPGLKVLLTSGYHREAIETGDPALRKMSFLPKPFSPEDLARAVRKALDASSQKG